jgi:hypothetical protein
MVDYNPLLFVVSGYEKSDGEWTDNDRKDIAVIRQMHSELKDWGDLAIGSAWSSFSQDVMEVNWCEWLIGEKQDIFLEYISSGKKTEL